MKKDDLSAALKALRNGETIIYPTDTQYALGADIYNDIAVKKVFQIKKRPYSIPLPIAVSSIQEIENIAFMNEIAKVVSEIFLPGNLTIILKKKQTVPDLVTSGFNNVAIRIPNDSIALKLLSLYGPLTVTSANLHQKKTPDIVKDILKQLETAIPVCLDDGRRQSNPSTIVNLSNKKLQIVREGSIKEKDLLDVISNG